MAYSIDRSMNAQCEYELIDISWSFRYQFQEDPGQSVHDESGNDTSQSEPSSIIERDAEGIPMGQSMQEVREREQIINAFFDIWYNGRNRDAKIYNTHLKGDILVKGISIDEAKHHSCKSYLSTIAVIKYLEEVLANALPVRRTNVKPGNKNQSRFDYMLIMKHEIENLGTVKLTVGIRNPKGCDQEVRTEYGMSVLKPGEELIEKAHKTSKKNR